MTEQMKIALDKAAVGAQWADGRILLNKDTLQPADPATTPLDKLVSVPVPDKLYIAVHFGAKWYIKNVWHDINEKPDMSKFVVFSDGKESMTPPMRNPFDDFPMLIEVANKKYGGGYKVWAYADDLLPIESDIPEQK